MPSNATPARTSLPTGLGSMLRPSAAGGWLARIAVAAVAWAAAATPAAEPVKLDKPVRVSATATDKTKVVGRVASYDDAGFELLDEKNAAKTLKWSSLPAKSVMEVYAVLLAKGTAQDWVAAGRVMYHLDGGKDYGERAFARALRLDPKVKAPIEAAKSAPPAGAATTTASAGVKPADAGGKEMVGDPGEGATQEDVLKKLWAPQTEAEQAASVAALKAFVAKHPKLKDESLGLYETKYFLFYSDLKRDEAQKWAGLLDRMYDRLAELFAVPKGSNIWRGKCLIFVFAKPADYHAHELSTYGVDSSKSAGMCHSYGNGFVHVAFYRQQLELKFAHVLVHESVHGFVHRYRSHVTVPNWANEGLAEVIAAELVPDKAGQKGRRFEATDGVRTNGGVGPTFYSARNIEGWQYPVAENLAAFMIAANKKGYVAFINGVKDGTPPEESLEKNFGADRDRMTAAYIESLGVKLKKGK